MQKMDRLGRPAAPKLKKVLTTTDTHTNEQYSYQDNCLSALMQSSAARQLLEAFDVQLFVGEQRQQLAQYLKTHSEKIESVPKELHNIETYVKIVQLKAETRYEAWSEPELQLEVARLLRQTEIDQKKQTTEQLMRELRDAEVAEDELRADELRAKLHRLIKETRRG